MTGVRESLWLTCPPELFFSKNDSSDPRLGDLTRTPHPNALVAKIWGYPDDEGVANNRGRPGAALAPDLIRKTLYKLTAGRNWVRRLNLVDHGNLKVGELTLPERHLQAQALSFREACAPKQVQITLGGGHDYGYPDVAGWLQAQVQTSPDRKPIVVNFDAHLDVRPLGPGGLIHSGTPFFRLLENPPTPFDFYEIGIQAHSHSVDHYDYVLAKGGRVLMRELLSSPTATLSELEVSLWQDRPVFVSFDMDVFSSAVAPGCSQSFGSGLMPDTVWWLFDEIFSRGRPSALGLYEVSPPFDIDEQTAKLAAVVAHGFLQRWFLKVNNG